MKILKNDSGYVLFMVVSMIVALSFFLMAIFTVYRVRFAAAAREGNKVKARYLAEAGVEKVKYLFSEDRKGLKLDTLQEDSISENSRYRYKASLQSGYVEVMSEGIVVRSHVKINATLGQKATDNLAPAISLNEPKSDLVVAGGNKINGDVSLIQGQLFPARAGGINFTGDKMLTGKVIQRTKADTLCDNGIKERIQTLSRSFSTAEGYDIIIKASLFFSANQPYDREYYRNKRVYVEGVLGFSDSIVIAGPAEFIVEQDLVVEGNPTITNMHFVCGNKIKVKGDTRLNDCFGYARRGMITTDSASISGQFLSEDSIVFDKNASTQYPAFFYSLPTLKENRLSGGIYCNGSNNLCGAFVIGLRPGTSDSTIVPQRVFTLSRNSEITGIVYSSYPMEYLGTVTGHITTFSFTMSQINRTYKDWIFNTTTDRMVLSDNMVLPVIFSENPELAVLRIREE